MRVGVRGNRKGRCVRSEDVARYSHSTRVFGVVEQKYIVYTCPPHVLAIPTMTVAGSRVAGRPRPGRAERRAAAAENARLGEAGALGDRLELGGEERAERAPLRQVEPEEVRVDERAHLRERGREARGEVVESGAGGSRAMGMPAGRAAQGQPRPSRVRARPSASPALG